MRVSRWLYVHVCERTRIAPLTVTEMKILNEVTGEDGYFDPDEYLERMKRTPIYITERQRYAMHNIPTEEDDPFTADEKNHRMEEWIKKARFLNSEVSCNTHNYRRH